MLSLVLFLKTGQRPGPLSKNVKAMPRPGPLSSKGKDNGKSTVIKLIIFVLCLNVDF